MSEEAIRSLAGHVSQQMLQRYSHVRGVAKLSAIAEFERSLGGEDGVQDRAHSGAAEAPRPN